MDGNGWDEYHDMERRYYALKQYNMELGLKVGEFNRWMTSFPFSYPARLLSLAEAKRWAYEWKKEYDVAPVFCEFRDKEEAKNYPPWRLGGNQRSMLENAENDYNVEFRFWSARPSEDEMKIMQWKERDDD